MFDRAPTFHVGAYIVDLEYFMQGDVFMDLEYFMGADILHRAPPFYIGRRHFT